MASLEPGLRDELITKHLRAALEELATERVERVELESAEAPERLSRHLMVVTRRLLASAGGDRERQAQLVNEVVSALGRGDADEADVLALPPELLTGIVPPAVGLEIPTLPARPTIPLTVNELLVNGHGQPAIGQQLRSELPSAGRVDLICAFVIWSGLRTLLDDLRAVTERGGQVRVITTTYMGATEPKALEQLVAVGADVKVAFDAERTKLHAKAWILHRTPGLTTALIGSSNVSHTALHQGLEWNVRLSETEAPTVVDRMRATFDTHWEDDAFESFDPERDRDRLRASLGRQRARKGAGSFAGGFVALDVEPKPHQRRMLEALRVQRERHDRHRNLLIAATGTGKTVVAALDYRGLRRQTGEDLSLLFLAHRRRILDQSRATFATVLKQPGFGELLGDGERPNRGRHVFAMVQSLDRESIASLRPDLFDVVIVDEVHHAAAASYRGLLEHIEPRELLGLTATPERMDGEDITHWFGGRTAFELRLWEAIDDGFLAPFQYFGVDDGIDLRDLEWRRGGYGVEALDGLYTGNDARVDKLLRAVDEISVDPNEMRALGFCVTVAHAEFMARAFTARGLASVALSGAVDSDERNRALARLERGELRCVFSVDVLGEGVDVPSVDTVLLLRPTQSATVLTQQLGRGLRHHPDKRCLTVIDLIGQQHRRFRFDAKLRALVDPRNGRLVDQAQDGFPFLPSGCEIKLDRQSRDVVLASLKAAVGSGQMSVLVEDLQRLGDVDLATFLRETDREPTELYRGPERSWTLLRRAAGLPTPRTGDGETRLLRPLHRLLHIDDLDRTRFYCEVLGRSAPPREADLDVPQRRLLTMLCLALFTKDRSRHASLDAALAKLWRFDAVRAELIELFGVLDDRSQSAPFRLAADVPLLVHAQYTRAEALVAYGDGSYVAPPTAREGVRWLPDVGVDVLFVTLRKTEKRYSPSTMYRDYALGSRLFHWESQSTTSERSPTGQRYVAHERDGSSVVLFVREHPTLASGAGAPFTCLGPATYVEHRSERPMQITWRLRHAIPEALLEQARLVAVG